MNLSVKDKTLVFVVIVFLLNLLVFGYIFYQNLQNDLQEIKQINFDKVKTSFEKNIEVHYNDFYQKKVQDIVTPEIVSLVKSKNKDALYEVLLPI